MNNISHFVAKRLIYIFKQTKYHVSTHRLTVSPISKPNLAFTLLMMNEALNKILRSDVRLNSTVRVKNIWRYTRFNLEDGCTSSPCGH
jgi:hypothetical protein